MIEPDNRPDHVVVDPGSLDNIRTLLNTSQRVDLSVYSDVIKLLNQRDVTNVDDAYGSDVVETVKNGQPEDPRHPRGDRSVPTLNNSCGRPTDYQAPLTFRLGGTVNFRLTGPHALLELGVARVIAFDAPAGGQHLIEALRHGDGRVSIGALFINRSIVGIESIDQFEPPASLAGKLFTVFHLEDLLMGYVHPEVPNLGPREILERRVA